MVVGNKNPISEVWNCVKISLNLLNRTVHLYSRECKHRYESLCLCVCVIVQCAASFRQYKGLWLGACDVWCNHAVWSAGFIYCKLSGLQPRVRPCDGTGGNRRAVSLSHFKEIYARLYQISNNSQLYLLSVCMHTCMFSWWKLPITKYLWL